MRYLIAILLPPLGMLSVGKPLEAFLCLLLMVTIIGHPIAAIWAVLVVHGSFEDRRARRIREGSSSGISRLTLSGTESTCSRRSTGLG